MLNKVEYGTYHLIIVIFLQCQTHHTAGLLRSWRQVMLVCSPMMPSFASLARLAGSQEIKDGETYGQVESKVSGQCQYKHFE